MKHLLVSVFLLAVAAMSAQEVPQASKEIPQGSKLDELCSAQDPADLPELQLFQSPRELAEAPKPQALRLAMEPADTEPPPIGPVVVIARTPRPQPFRKKIFFAEFAAYTVPNILDGITTVRGVRRGFTEAPFPKGSAEFLGSRPGVGRYVVTMGAMQTAAVFASYRLEHSQSRVLRMLGHGLMAKGIFDHTLGFVSNLRLGKHP